MRHLDGMLRTQTAMRFSSVGSTSVEQRDVRLSRAHKEKRYRLFFCGFDFSRTMDVRQKPDPGGSLIRA